MKRKAIWFWLLFGGAVAFYLWRKSNAGTSDQTLTAMLNQTPVTPPTTLPP